MGLGHAQGAVINRESRCWKAKPMASEPWPAPNRGAGGEAGIPHPSEGSVGIG